ncbi:hypothetical protein [Pontibacter sp. G13]|uniref:hypothetical protein n=1 Tax=Pontibacter sp. G13 TaxID=3074898 RepID=UPI00288C081F|nr:hypothetical protein [Pontibacter sp. G13]WNJ18659.1 hypothetical protein RJD25_27705 [Pontibacter sp. G13]
MNYLNATQASSPLSISASAPAVQPAPGRARDLEEDPSPVRRHAHEKSDASPRPGQAR